MNRVCSACTDAGEMATPCTYKANSHDSESVQKIGQFNPR